MTLEMYASSTGIAKAISPALARWRSPPFTRVTTSIWDRSAGGADGSPSAQNVSKPFARVHCPSLFCRSRAVTSFTATMPPIACATSLSFA